MFDHAVRVHEEDVRALSEALRSAAPESSAHAYRGLPAVLAAGDDTAEAIHARIDLALLCAREGLLEAALYQVDELTKDARRVGDCLAGGGGVELTARADAARDAIEGAAARARS